MVLSRNLLDLSYMPQIREIDDDVLAMWIFLSLNDITLEGVVLIFSVSARNFAVNHDDADLYIMPMWRLTWRPAPPWIVVMVMTFEKNPMVMMIIKMELLITIITDRLRTGRSCSARKRLEARP